MSDSHCSYWRAVRGEEIPSPEWPSIIARAEKEGMIGYLASRHPGIPDRNSRRHQSAAHNLAHVSLYRKVRAALDPLGIPWVVLKGIALGLSLYQDPVERSCGDLDVLVKPKDEEMAARALSAAGFARTPHHRELYAGPEGNIDLHTAFLNVDRIRSRGRVLIDPPDWSERIRRVGAPPDDVPALHEEDLARYLTVHLVHHHGCVGTKWLVDLAQLLRRREDLAGVVRKSSRSGPVVQEILDALIKPRGARSEVKARESAPPAAIDRIVLRAAYEGSEIPGLRFILTLRDMPRAQDKAAFLKETLLPKRDVMVSAGYKSRRDPVVTHLKNLAATVSGLVGTYRRSGRSAL